jgi:peptidoglycan/LPS O-acetylase OafA/YrhL
MQAKDQNQTHVEFLDWLRGVAVLAVLFGHTYSTAYSDYEALPWSGWFRDLAGLTKLVQRQRLRLIWRRKAGKLICFKKTKI